MDRIRLIAQDGVEITPSLEYTCKVCSDGFDSESYVLRTCEANCGKRRVGKLYDETVGTVFFCTGDKEKVRSNKVFLKEQALLKNIISHVAKIRNDFIEDGYKSTNRLLHNLVSLNAKNIQEIYSSIPESEGLHAYKDQVASAEKAIDNNKKEVAKSIIRVAKNNMAIKTEFTVFHKLFADNPELSIRRHDVKKVIMSVFHVFFEDFFDVKVHINTHGDTFFVNIDYETVRVALYHLVENASKYVLPNTTIDIYLLNNSDGHHISMEMNSLEMTDEDIKYLFEEGYSGVYSHLSNKNGEGIGMPRVKKLLDMNQIALKIERSIDGGKPRSYKNVSYVRNRFLMSF
tara:strand:- start:10860 stop:11894 length:1035 start_codon:yes stop_codon:yes gene_type:complete